MELLEIRRQINSIDSEIINLLAKRAVLVLAAGKLKKDEQGVWDPKRVEQVIEKARSKAASARLSPEIAEKVYRTIVECFINKELLDFNRRDKNKMVWKG